MSLRVTSSDSASATPERLIVSIEPLTDVFDTVPSFNDTAKFEALTILASNASTSCVGPPLRLPGRELEAAARAGRDDRAIDRPIRGRSTPDCVTVRAVGGSQPPHVRTEIRIGGA